MRHGAAIGTGMGIVLVLASLAGPQDPSSLQKTLDETVRAIAVLSGLEKDIATKDAVAPERAVEIARTASEPAFGDERARDDALQTLRKDVAGLQMEHDELLRAASVAPTSTDVARASEAGAPILLPITTGLDDRQRAELSFEPRATFVPLSSTAGTTTNVPRDDAADALRQGQAFFRAAKYGEALIALRRIEGDVRAKYWIARTLEKLARNEEAVELYRAVEADANAGYLATRAKNDREFLEWKRAFAKKLEAESAAKTPAKPADAAKPAKKEPGS